MLASAAGCPLLVLAGVAAGHGMFGAAAATCSAVLFVWMVREQRALAHQARYARRQRQRARLRLAEPEMWLEQFRHELDEWDMTVESLLAKAGPEPPRGFVYATPPAFYDQDEDTFGDLL
jgi:hypothetical protein